MGKRGWRYDFRLQKTRFTKTGYKTKREAKEAQAKRREELTTPIPMSETLTPTDMAFFTLVNKRLDFVRAYHSASHYASYRSNAKKWIKKWGKLSCDEISCDMVQTHLLKRSKVSNYTSNLDLRCLRSLFNFGITRKWIKNNPTVGISYFPIEKKLKYIPKKEEIQKVLDCADTDTQDYLRVIKDTMGRMTEINRLKWKDVSFDKKFVVLYTRKKKGSNLTPRKIPMTEKLFEVLSRRYESRDKSKPWVFWHRYWSKKEGDWVEGPYKERRRIMKTLCRKAGVQYFRFHTFRHFGASVLDNANVATGSIQRILGHENRRTTENYLHSIGEAERDAMMIYERECESTDHPENS